MGLKNFTVSLDHPFGTVYFPTSIISGTVTIVLDKPKKTKGVHVELEGKGRVQWSEASAINKSRVYSSEETYLSTTTCLSGEKILAEGLHNFPFSFILPKRLPSSFEGTHGHVRYTAAAKIVRSWLYDHVSYEPFIVSAIVDLNRDLQNRILPSGEANKSLCCLWCRSGPIHIEATLLKSGFVPGETILLDADVSNKSGRTVSEVVATFLQTVTYRTPNQTKVERRKLGRVRRGSIHTEGRQVWFRQPLLSVPLVPPTKLGQDDCNVIDVAYHVEVKAKTPMFSADLKVSIPVMIGNIPLVEVDPLSNVRLVNSAETSDKDLPTYDECVATCPTAPERSVSSNGRPGTATAVTYVAHM